MRPRREFLSLLKACKEAPREDAPRLVLADWLEEHGDPYGAVVRLQCQAERLDEADPRRAELENAAEQALEAAWPAWLTIWRTLTPHAYPVRGLLAVTLEGDGWLARPPSETMWAWVENLTLNQAPARALPALAALPRSAGLTELTIHGPVLTPERAEELARAPALATLARLHLDAVCRGQTAVRSILALGRLTRLRHLELSVADLQGNRLRRVVESDLAGRLAHLGLSGNFFGEPGAEILAEATALAGLEVLDVAVCSIGDRGLDYLARAPFPRLRDMRVNANDLRASAVEVLARAPWLGGLEALNLDNNELGEAAVRDLAALAPPPGLRSLDLGLVRARDSGVAALAASPWLPPLRSLDLGQNDLTNRGARALAEVPFERLTSLALGWNGIGPQGIPALAQAASLSPLRDLVLAGCPLGGRGAKALAASPVLRRLRHLHLNQCKIDDAGASALAESPVLASVRVLGLSDNELTDSGAAALARSPHLAGLRHLMLDSNPIGDAGARALAESPYLGHLQTLVASYTQIGDAGRSALRARFPWAEVEEDD